MKLVNHRKTTPIFQSRGFNPMLRLTVPVFISNSTENVKVPLDDRSGLINNHAVFNLKYPVRH
jgi:hypothetical protein